MLNKERKKAIEEALERRRARFACVYLQFQTLFVFACWTSVVALRRQSTHRNKRSKRLFFVVAHIETNVCRSVMILLKTKTEKNKTTRSRVVPHIDAPPHRECFSREERFKCILIRKRNARKEETKKKKKLSLFFIICHIRRHSHARWRKSERARVCVCDWQMFCIFYSKTAE